MGTDGKRIAVVGAGVIGLSTAVRLQESLGKQDNVTVFGRELPPKTTGDSAAGLWEPVYFSQTPEEKIRSWGKRTWDFLQTFLGNENHPELGVYYTPFYQFFKDEREETPFWADIIASFHFLDRDEVEGLWHRGRSGFMATSMMAEGGRMVDYMLRRFIAGGGRCLQRGITSFDELVAEGFDLVLNCAGLGAKALCSDPDVYPIRGQITMVRAPWVRAAMFTEENYILPKQDCVVLGGTRQVGDWDETVREDDRRHILHGCCEMVPGLQAAPVVKEWTGLRPGRKEVRLEVERRRSSVDKRLYTVVHNYGHGGSGFTLFWGCAEDACHLALTALGRSHVHRL